MTELDFIKAEEMLLKIERFGGSKLIPITNDVFIQFLYLTGITDYNNADQVREVRVRLETPESNEDRELQSRFLALVLDKIPEGEVFGSEVAKLYDDFFHYRKFRSGAYKELMNSLIKLRESLNEDSPQSLEVIKSHKNEDSRASKNSEKSATQEETSQNFLQSEISTSRKFLGFRSRLERVFSSLRLEKQH